MLVIGWSAWCILNTNSSYCYLAYTQCINVVHDYYDTSYHRYTTLPSPTGRVWCLDFVHEWTCVVGMHGCVWIDIFNHFLQVVCDFAPSLSFAGTLYFQWFNILFYTYCCVQMFWCTFMVIDQVCFPTGAWFSEISQSLSTGAIRLTEALPRALHGRWTAWWFA